MEGRVVSWAEAAAVLSSGACGVGPGARSGPARVLWVAGCCWVVGGWVVGGWLVGGWVVGVHPLSGTAQPGSPQGAAASCVPLLDRSYGTSPGLKPCVIEGAVCVWLSYRAHAGEIPKFALPASFLDLGRTIARKVGGPTQLDRGGARL